ncbi:IS66 family insertion sequence element accessory protein TnpB [Myxococcus sp. K15C18031901]|uniref:IS66 family insertion sequence element accessory protein TnpA n=1 Tax=Myxococcus dinghuensis TaxID=2906761 RepID=UPI0020A7869E|nr:IS66 family insertion sequence element accessory protein TnpB [Myxococcus dinghuensis]MCP3104554.1 IS66 family insertion sequence element accessory protein TnpB [Myxococcus dinghuensis]
MRRPNPDEWPKLVEEFEASGLQQKEFVAKHDLSLGTLQYWLYKKRKKRGLRASDLAAESVAAFLPLEVVASPAPQARESFFEVATVGGLVLRFPVGADAAYVARLLVTLASTSTAAGT